MSRYLTVGMAGHIDHGKTTLTKALTGVNTDRLKEEKERNISIEPGFALFIQEEDLEVSIIDVPGHEKFIRQMIAGVAGIDYVVLVIAADEGMMPQTKEHLDILSLLGLEEGCIVLTKLDQVEDELLNIVKDDIREELKNSFLAGAKMHLVDSLSGKGIETLFQELRKEIELLPKRNIQKPFRLPIDQVFTVKGQGVIVRGTVYDGEVRQGDQLTLLPSGKEVRVRQIQRHRKQKDLAEKGQRTAINLGGISHQEISRGDVLVKNDFYTVSDRIDISFQPLEIEHKIKQRQLVKLHIGTSEVMGKIIFFDRNEISNGEKEAVLCQLQLEEEIVVMREDRFILRRPTPAETIGGGWVIEPQATKHRFGRETIEQLRVKKEGDVKERIASFIKENLVVTATDITRHISLTGEELNEARTELVEIEPQLFTLHSIFQSVQNEMIQLLKSFHKKYPIRIGMNKAEVFSTLQGIPESLQEFALKGLQTDNKIQLIKQYISMADHSPTLPTKWKTALEQIENDLIVQGIEVEKWEDLVQKYEIPDILKKEYYYYLIETDRAYKFDEERIVSKTAFNKQLKKLKHATNGEDFTLQTARDILQLTRKNLIPLLELFDHLGYTKREENHRKWIVKL